VVARFSDGEVWLRSTKRRGKDVFVLQSTCQPTTTTDGADHHGDALKRPRRPITAAIPTSATRARIGGRAARGGISAKVVANMLQAVA